MKLINNQEIRLLDEIRPLLVQGAEVYLCASYVTINALYELESELKKVSFINVLLDSNDEKDIRLVYHNKEWQTYLDLKGLYKSQLAINLAQDKCNIMFARYI